MKSLFNKYIWLQLILSILLLFGGALIIAFAIMGKDNILEDGLNIISAVILFLFGGFAILATLVFEQNKYLTNGLLYGSACIALGVFLCMKEMILLDYLVYLLAIFFYRLHLQKQTRTCKHPLALPHRCKQRYIFCHLQAAARQNNSSRFRRMNNAVYHP